MQVGGRLIATVDLYNYNIDGNLLKPEHKAHIDQKVVPVLRKHKAHVKIIGTASQSGDRAYNQQLSVERVLRVKNYLLAKGFSESQVPGAEMRAYGEDLSTSKSSEDERDRAVKIVLAWGTKPQPIIIFEDIVIVGDRPVRLPVPRPRPIPSGVSKKWKIRYLSGADASLFKMLGFSGNALLIVDTTNNLEIVCVMAGGTVSAFPGTPASVTLRGQWTDFATPDPHSITEFDSIISNMITPASVGPLSGEGRLTVPGISNGDIRFSTGFTFGASAGSMVVGPLKCSPPRSYKPTWRRDIITGEWELE